MGQPGQGIETSLDHRVAESYVQLTRIASGHEECANPDGEANKAGEHELPG